MNFSPLCSSICAHPFPFWINVYLSIPFLWNQRGQPLLRPLCLRYCGQWPYEYPAAGAVSRGSDVYWGNPHGSTPNKATAHVLAVTHMLKHLLCQSLSSPHCQGGSTMNDWRRELWAALSQLCSLLQSMHLWFALSLLSPSAPIPSALLLGWGWWSEKADLSPRGKFALLMHGSQCCTSESYCMLHCKHGGRHLAESSKGHSLWFFFPSISQKWYWHSSLIKNYGFG